MFKKEKIERYTYSYLENLLKNHHELALEVEETNGVILHYLESAQFKPSLEFFIEYQTVYSLPFIKVFYPNVILDDVIQHKSVKVKKDFTIFLKETSLSTLKENKTILADFFLNKLCFPNNSVEVNYPVQISMLVSSLFESFPEITNQELEELFDKQFFDYYFQNVKYENCIWNEKLVKQSDNIFVFALKSYLIDFAVNDWFRGNSIARRLYANLSFALAKKQDFINEPKFNHKIIPTLLQNDTLDILIKDANDVFSKVNPAFIYGLLDKHISINLMILFILYLKDTNNSKSVYNIIFECLNKGLSKFDNDTTNKILSFLNYSTRKDSLFLNENHPLVDVNNIDKAYSVFDDMKTFLGFISYRLLNSINKSFLIPFIKDMPTTWNSSTLYTLEKIFQENIFEKMLIENIEEKNSLFDFPSEMIIFMLKKNSLNELLYEKFPNDFEKIFNELFAVEEISSISIEHKDKIKEPFQFQIDNNIINAFKKRNFMPPVIVKIIEKVLPVFLINRDYKKILTFFNMIAFMGNSDVVKKTSMDLWKDHLKKMPVTNLMLNASNKRFVTLMYFVSEIAKRDGDKIVFPKLKPEDAKNIYLEINKFFMDKSVPLEWLPSLSLTWKEQKEFVPNLLMSQYDKALNRNIKAKLSPAEFKELLVSYLDGFVMSVTPSDNTFHTTVKEFNPLFVNSHLKDYKNNLSVLLKELEDRPEYYVIVALNAYPKMFGNTLQRLNFLMNRKVSKVAKMDLKSIFKLNFSSEHNKYEEINLFLKDKVNWEICFVGIIKLVQNLYWVAKNREVDLQAKNILDLVVNVFWSFNTIYSYSRGIEQNKNVDYSYLLDVPFFHLFQDSEFNKSSSIHEKKKSLSQDGKDNFITSLLRHLRYEKNNDDSVIPDIFIKCLNSINDYGVIASGDYQDSSKQHEYIQKAFRDVLNYSDFALRINIGFILNVYKRLSAVDFSNIQFENNQKEILFTKEIFFLLKSGVDLISNDTKAFIEDWNIKTSFQIRKSFIEKNIAPISESYKESLIPDEVFKM